MEDDEKPHSSDEDDGFEDILPEMPKEETGDVDYDKYKQFYADEIEGWMHWW